MKRENISFDSKEEWLKARTLDITSTEVSALFGVSPYMTEYELWYRKKEGDVGSFEPSERMVWGIRLEDTVARGIAEDQGWKVRAWNTYGRVPELRIGSSFDYRILGEDKAVLEVKCVDGLIARDKWDLSDPNPEAPVHIEFQVQHQMLVSGYDRAVIGALVGGNTVHLIHRRKDERVHRAILDRVRGFWASIEANRPPEPDFNRDAAFITAQNFFAEPGKVLDATEDEAVRVLCERYTELGSTIRGLTKDRDAFKAELLTKIGDAEKVLATGFTISAGMVGETEVSYTRKAYRNVRVTAKKKKEDKS